MLDDQQVVSAALAQVSGVGMLGRAEHRR